MSHTARAGVGNYSIGAVMRRIVPLAKEFVWQYAAAFILLILTTLLGLVPPMLLKVLIDDAIRTRNVTMVHLMAAALVAAALFTGLLRGVMEYVHEWVSAHFILKLRSLLLTRVFGQGMTFFADSRTGDIIARLRNDTTVVYGVLVNTFLGGVSEVVQIAGTAGVLLYMNWRLALIALSFSAPLYFMVVISGKRIRQFSLKVRDKDAGLLDFFQERITNIQTVKLFHREEFEEDRHEELSRDVIEVILSRVRYKFFWMFLVLIFTTVAGILVVWYGGLKVIEGSLSFGALIAFYLYTSRLYTPIQSMANRGVEVYNGLASAQRLLEYMDLTPTLLEDPNSVVLRQPHGRIEFRNVTFGYPRREGFAIRNFNLTIRPGEKIALVGQSGAGKTTLVHLLCRLYDVNSGSISIDGEDVRSIAFDSLYDTIAVVPQETCLFNATVEENIRYGDPHASFERVVEAAKAAQVHEFIQTLPAGYSTNLGPRGTSLSGGQRQRLALARVLLKPSRIWVLDEFTSALDSQSEDTIYESIRPLLQDKTAIIIAHRLSTLLSADRVIVLQQGVVVEAGTHAELQARNGAYRKLFDHQFRQQAAAEETVELVGAARNGKGQ